MRTLVLTIHVIVCVVMCVVVLLQQGKGADVGAVFGGSSQTVFGASGAGNFLTRLTGIIAVVFFATSIYLAYQSSMRMSSSIFDTSQVPSTSAPAKAGAKAPSAPARKASSTESAPETGKAKNPGGHPARTK